MIKNVDTLVNDAQMLYQKAVFYNCDHGGRLEATDLTGMLEDMAELMQEMTEKMKDMEVEINKTNNKVSCLSNGIILD